MTTAYTDILTPAELDLLLSLPEVVAAKARLDAATCVNGMVYLSVAIPDSIKAAVAERFSLDLSAVTTVPMRWIKGDTAPHIDRGAGDFNNTYLMYVNSSPGELIVDGQSYPMEAGSGYVFNEGLQHETRGAVVDRLLLGPMSEAGFMVGGATIAYFPTQADALTFTNQLGYTYSGIVGNAEFGTNGGYTSWRIASNSTGTASQVPVYPNGSTLVLDGNYFLYPAAPCFLEGSKLLCQEGTAEVWKPIETIRKGDLVKTSRDGFKAVVMIGKGTMENPGTEERIESRLYVCSKDQYPELTEDLVLTGCHSILVPTLTDAQRAATEKALGQVFVTDRRYRLMAWLDERAKPWAVVGSHPIWHLALEHVDEAMNYGVFANGGLLVETCCIKFMRDKSNMEMV